MRERTSVYGESFSLQMLASVRIYVYDIPNIRDFATRFSLVLRVRPSPARRAFSRVFTWLACCAANGASAADFDGLRWIFRWNFRRFFFLVGLFLRVCEMDRIEVIFASPDKRENNPINKETQSVEKCVGGGAAKK